MTTETGTVRIALTNLGKYNEGSLVFKWLDLPYTDEDLQETLKAIGINEEYEEYFISDTDSDITGLTIGEYDDIEELNDLITDYDNLDEWDRGKIAAIIESDSISLKEAMECVDEIELIPDVDNERDLGYYYVEDSGIYDTKSLGPLANYIDYESFGRDIQLDKAGSFTSYGYVTRR